MRDMFYNYEHRIDHKVSPKLATYDQPKMLDACGNAERLKNAKGDMIGVKGKVNSNFFLYFDFDGEVRSDSGEFEMTLREALESSELYFDVLDQKRDVVASFKPTLDADYDEIRVQVLASEEGPLKYGVYRMHLYFDPGENMGAYSLFLPEDGVLSIE